MDDTEFESTSRLERVRRLRRVLALNCNVVSIPLLSCPVSSCEKDSLKSPGKEDLREEIQRLDVKPGEPEYLEQDSVSMFTNSDPEPRDDSGVGFMLWPGSTTDHVTRRDTSLETGSEAGFSSSATGAQENARLPQREPAEEERRSRVSNALDGRASNSLLSPIARSPEVSDEGSGLDSDSDWISICLNSDRLESVDVPADSSADISAAVQRVFSAYAISRQHGRGSGSRSHSKPGGLSSNTDHALDPTPGGSGKQLHQNKRTGSTNHGENNEKDSDDDDDDGERPRKRRKAPKDADSQKERPLACPFYKFDRVKYAKCCQYAQAGINRLRQHLRRSHTQPLHCLRCKKEFHGKSADQEAAQHGEQPCEVQRTKVDGISAAKMALITKRAERNQCEQTWYGFFEYIFGPEVTKPDDPWPEKAISQEMAELERFFRSSEGAELIRNEAQQLLRTTYPEMCLDDTLVLEYSRALIRRVNHQALQTLTPLGPCVPAPTTVLSPTMSESVQKADSERDEAPNAVLEPRECGDTQGSALDTEFAMQEFLYGALDFSADPSSGIAADNNGVQTGNFDFLLDGPFPGCVLPDTGAPNAEIWNGLSLNSELIGRTFPEGTPT